MLVRSETTGVRLEISAKGVSFVENTRGPDNEIGELQARPDASRENSEWHFAEMIANALDTSIKMYADTDRGVVYSIPLPGLADTEPSTEYQI